MYDKIFLATLSYAFFRGIRGNFRILSSFQKLNELYSQVMISDESQCQESALFTILIPVLREQEVIKKIIENILLIKGNFQAVFITTERESAEREVQKRKLNSLKHRILKASNREEIVNLLSGILPASLAAEGFEMLKSQPNDWHIISNLFEQLKLTKEVIEESIKTLKREQISVIHYPNTQGNKTNQLNYAIKELEKGKDGHNEFLLFYDADSHVHQDTIINLQKYLAFYPQANVIQQSALFLSNFEALSGSYQKSFLQAIALLQSRWTMAHEVPRILNQFETKIGNYLEGSHLVAHGLFIRLSVLQNVGYFPDSFITEDLPLGYLVRLSGEKIYPFPILENTQSPTTIRGMFNMYENWFLGVIGYIKCSLKSILKRDVPKLRAAIWGSTYFIRSTFWLFLSVIWIYLLVYPLLSDNLLFGLLSVTAFVIYAPLSFALFKSEFNQNSHLIAQERQQLKVEFGTYLATVPAYLTHSYSPIVATFKLVVSLLTRSKINRKKTER